MPKTLAIAAGLALSAGLFALPDTASAGRDGFSLYLPGVTLHIDRHGYARHYYGKKPYYKKKPKYRKKPKRAYRGPYYDPYSYYYGKPRYYGKPHHYGDRYYGKRKHYYTPPNPGQLPPQDDQGGL